MSTHYRNLLTSLKNNHESGATELALQTLTDLQHFLESKTSLSQERLEELVTELQAARPSMVTLANVLERWRRSWPAATAQDDTAYLTSLSELRQQLSQVSARVTEHASSLFKPGMTIMTHSRSSQVTALLESLRQHLNDIRVFITISAPGNEGYLLAKQLNSIKLPVTLITDAEMGLVMPEVDINISGCDCWLSDHYFVNKSGTLLQALAAQHFGKPFWVLADSFKNCHLSSKEVQLESMPTLELHLPHGNYISGRNTYFEPVSTRLISGRVDEQGLQAMNG